MLFFRAIVVSITYGIIYGNHAILHKTRRVNMRKIVRRCVGVFELLGLVALASSIIAAAVALRHIIDTPQPLESILPGEAHLYRGRHGHIFYKVLGNRDAPPLVMLHTPSLGNSAYEMRKIVRALTQEYRVYTIDLLGIG